MNWSYIAGFFDGEGSVGVILGGAFPHRSARLQISIAQAEHGGVGPKLMHEIQEYLRSNGIESAIKIRQPKKNAQTMYYLMIWKNESAVLFLRSVMPFLRIKKVHAQDVIRYFRLYPLLRIHGSRFHSCLSPRNISSKISREQAMEIRRLYASAVSRAKNRNNKEVDMRELARRFGIGASSVCRIINNERWA